MLLSMTWGCSFKNENKENEPASFCCSLYILENDFMIVHFSTLSGIWRLQAMILR